MRKLILAAALLLAAPARAELPVVELSAGIHLIRAELAGTFTTRMQGLMHRKTLGANAGMLFDFERADVHCMWMKNTLIPLAVAFIDDSGAVVNIAEMEPHSEASHCARRPVRYALEMNRGWFAQRGIKPGFRLKGFPAK